jgi:GNAT superfamily N-acetyltransferase
MKKYLEVIERENGITLVAEENDILIGLVQGTIVRHDNAEFMRSHTLAAVDGWVGNLYVDPRHRRTGLGKQLLETIEKYFAENGCTASRLTVLAHNANARSFYNRQGHDERDVELRKSLGSL